MITEKRLRIERCRAANAAMEVIMQINGNMVLEELGSKASYEASAKLLQGIKEDVSNMLDEKIEEIKKIVERKM